jgi:hypothetical protein
MTRLSNINKENFLKNREKYETGLFTIRFVGEEFNQRDVNI